MRKHHTSENELDVPIVPLIDIGFEMIIFFVLTGVQQNDLVDDRVALAQAKYIAPAQHEEPLKIIINMHQDGSINISRQNISLPELRNILQASVSRYGNNIPIVLRCDGKSLYKEVDKVMNVITGTGLYRVRIAAMVNEG